MSRNFGRYRADEPLGRGAMGEVWRGYDPQLARTVAIKVLSPANELPEAMRQEYRERFLREARAAAGLTHPNIVAVHDIGIEDDVPFLVMELVAGGSLDDLLKKGAAFSLEEAATIGASLARALACAHEAGIVHRDVKPANVLRSEEGIVKLMDFGIARLAASTLTEAGAFIGSPLYAAPEQIRGEVVTAASDMFSLGVLIYALVTAKHPFRRATLPETARAIVREDAKPPSAHRPEAGASWDRLLGRVLDKDPQKRFSSAVELADAFDALATDTPGGEETPRFELSVVEGPDKGLRVTLESELEIGRHRGDLALTDETASGRHCRVALVGGKAMVYDLGSRNGIWVGSERVSETELSVGGIFAIGQHTKIRLTLPGETAPAAEPAAEPDAGGTLLDAGSSQELPAVRPLSGATRFAVEVTTGPAAGTKVTLSGSITFGRDKGDVVLSDPKVSGRHASIEMLSSTRFQLRDLASSNGTFFRGERIRDVELKPGDEFTMGDSVIRFDKS